jgi:DNA repair photolyase
LDAVAALNDAGVACGVMLAPIMPGITDDKTKMREVVRAAIDAGATHVSPILLHLRPKVREEFMKWLEDAFPDLVPRYEKTYRASAYATAEARRATARTVGQIVGEAGGLKPRPGVVARFHRGLEPDRRARAERKPRQLRLL